MKHVPLSLAILLMVSTANGQTNLVSMDSFLIRTIRKQIAFPDIEALDTSGVALIKISKTIDSLHIDVLYSSGSPFSLTEDKYLRQRLNVSKNKFPDGYMAFIPLHFDYFKEGEEPVPLNIKSSKELELKINQLGNKSHVLRAVSIPGYQTVR